MRQRAWQVPNRAVANRLWLPQLWRVRRARSSCAFRLRSTLSTFPACQRPIVGRTWPVRVLMTVPAGVLVGTLRRFSSLALAGRLMRPSRHECIWRSHADPRGRRRRCKRSRSRRAPCHGVGHERVWRRADPGCAEGIQFKLPDWSRYWPNRASAARVCWWSSRSTWPAGRDLLKRRTGGGCPGRRGFGGCCFGRWREPPLPEA